MTVAADVEKEVGNIIEITEERILAAMELAGLLQTVEDNVVEVMDQIAGEMSPEEAENKREQILDAIYKGRHEVIKQLDDDLLVLLARSACGDICFIKSGQTRH